MKLSRPRKVLAATFAVLLPIAATLAVGCFFVWRETCLESELA